MNLFEIDIIKWVYTWCGSPVMDTIQGVITLFGEYGAFWIAVALCLLITKKYRKTGLMLGIAFLFGVILGNAVLKNCIARIRPYDIDSTVFHLVPWLKKTWDYSFPSGHALVSFEAATVLMKVKPKPWGIVSLVLALAVSFSRIYMGVHYPTDILGGAFFGILFGVCGIFIGERLYRFLGKMFGKKKKLS